MWPHLDQRGSASQANYHRKTSLYQKTNTKDKYYEEANKDEHYEKANTRDEYYKKANKTTNQPKEAG